jgi:prevent-host-death family protein
VDSSNHKGAVAELEVAAAAVKLGIPVFRPLSEHSRADLVLEIGGRLMRVQCKWGRLSESRDVVIVRVGGSWLSPHGYVRTTYTEHEIDLFGVYCGELDRSFLIPVSTAAGKHAIHLRLLPPRNSQRASINLASDFEFDGAIAQLGERVNGIHEVAGSSPASSTPQSATESVGVDEFRRLLGWYVQRASRGDRFLVTRRGRPLVRLLPPIDQLPFAS